MPHKPRILYLVGWFYPDSVGGSEHYVYLLAKDIQARGWEVMVAAPSIDEEEHNYIHDGIAVYRYPVTTHPSLPEVRSEVPPRHFEIFQDWLRRNKPDIVHIHSRTRGCGFFHMRYVKQLGIPLVLTIHAADFMCVGGTAMLWGVYPCDGVLRNYRCTACWLKKQGVPWLIAIILARAPISIANQMRNIPNKLATSLAMVKLFIEKREHDKIIVGLSDKVVVVSKWLLEVFLLNGIPREKIFFSPHGLPQEAIDYKDHRSFRNSGPLRIGFIGRFNYIKGPHILIKAIKRLPKDCRVELRLYGRINSREDERYFKRLKKITHNDVRIKFCGELRQENYQEAMRNLDIIAVPSLWLETGPLVVLEAFIAGIPVIGSNAGSIPELVTDGVYGMLVEIGNVKAWANAIMWACQNPQVLRDWASHIPDIRSNIDVAEDMIGIYEDILVKRD